MKTTRRGLFGWLAGGAAVAAPEVAQAWPPARVVGSREALVREAIKTLDAAYDGAHTHSFRCDELPAHSHHFATRLDERGFRRIS
jgi:hypothetical protein